MLSAADESGSRQSDVQVNHDTSSSNTQGAPGVGQHQHQHHDANHTAMVGGGGALGGGNGSPIEALKTAVAASDPHALTKLLEHIESLKHSNAAMSETLDEEEHGKVPR